MDFGTHFLVNSALYTQGRWKNNNCYGRYGNSDTYPNFHHSLMYAWMMSCVTEEDFHHKPIREENSN